MKEEKENEKSPKEYNGNKWNVVICKGYHIGAKMMCMMYGPYGPLTALPAEKLFENWIVQE